MHHFLAVGTLAYSLRCAGSLLNHSLNAVFWAQLSVCSGYDYRATDTPYDTGYTGVNCLSISISISVSDSDLFQAALETVKTKRGFELLNADEHKGILTKHKKEPSEYRPDIVHQVRHGESNV